MEESSSSLTRLILENYNKPLGSLSTFSSAKEAGKTSIQWRKPCLPWKKRTPAGEEYYEVSNERGAVLATKNHQGGLDDQDDESNGKIFERPGFKRCPVKLISKYLRHLNPESNNLFKGQEALARHSILPKMNCGSTQFHWVIIRLKTGSAVWPPEEEYSRIWLITRSGQPLWRFYQQQITRVDT